MKRTSPDPTSLSVNTLRHYGINNHVCQWINTKRSQRVALDSSFSDFVPVHSGVPQGTVLGPLLFLLNINGISEHLNSPLRLFADDCLLYRTITTDEDTIQLQRDLYRNGQLSGS